MTESLIQGVPDTARLVAAFRAAETERPDALFHDPLAARLAGEHGRQIIAHIKEARYGQWNVIIRTVIIDGHLARAFAEGVDTVVNLGAGLDARPYRLALPPGLRWVEVDFPAMLAEKEALLAGETPRCRLERVGIDLTDVPLRRKTLAALLAPSQRAVVLTEGVVPYLTTEVVGELARDLRALPQVQDWIVDYFSAETVRRRAKLTKKSQLANAPFQFAPEDWFGFFAARGWQAADVRYIVEEAEKLGRPFVWPLPVRVIMATIGRFAPPERKAAMRRFAGYVLLKPA
jgi:methyltransferase (TIGR00027 family)